MLLGNRMSEVDKRRLAMLYANNGGANLRQSLLDSAPFRSSLTYTVVPQSAASGSPTYTRATTATFTDFEGVLRTAIAGEARFVGARRVRNMLVGTESWLPYNAGATDSTWSTYATGATQTSGQADPNGGTSAIKIVYSGGTQLYGFRCVGLTKGRTYRWSVYAKTDSGTLACSICSTDTSAWGTASVSDNTLTTSWQRISVLIDTTAMSMVAGKLDVTVGYNGKTPTNVGSGNAFFAYPQLEDVTGQSVQTAGEYVSVGVVQRNLLLQSNNLGTTWSSTSATPTQNGPTPSGLNCGAGWTLSDVTGASLAFINQTVTLTAASYTLSVLVKKTSGSQSSYPIVSIQAGTTIALATVDTSNGVATVWTAYTGLSIAGGCSASCASFDSNYWKVSLTFTATAAGWAATLIPAGTANATQSTGVYDNTAQGTAVFAAAMLALASVDQTYQDVGGTYVYHGAGVDGVKYFDTTLAGAYIPASTLKGYLSEGSRQNICLQSNAFTTTWTASSLSTLTQNAIGPDGATSAWTFTDSSGAALGYVTQSITLTAAAYTFSVFVKKTTGALSAYPILTFFTGTTYALATIDTSNGVITPWTSITGGTMLAGVSARISSFNSDYWRAELTATGTAALYSFALEPAAAGTSTYAGPTLDATLTGTQVFYGAQVELGSFASSLISTTTVPVTRNADVLTYPSAGNISGTVGWAYAEFSTQGAGTTQYIIDGSAPSGNRPCLYYNTDNTLRLYDGVGTRNLKAWTPSPTPSKVVTTWAGVASMGAVSGSVGNSLGFDGDLNVGTNIGIGGIATTEAFGTIRNVRIGQRALSSSELQAITK